MANGDVCEGEAQAIDARLEPPESTLGATGRRPQRSRSGTRRKRPSGYPETSQRPAWSEGEAQTKDVRREASEATISELQALIVDSRQLADIDYHELVMALSDGVGQLIVTKDPKFAIAIAAFALRIREEHLV